MPASARRLERTHGRANRSFPRSTASTPRDALRSSAPNGRRRRSPPKNWAAGWRRSPTGVWPGRNSADAVSATRLDVLMVTRNLVATRERARALILAGDVMVNGVPATKAGTRIADTATIEVRQPDHPWVGRGGVNLAHVLEVFGLDVTGRIALDIGAST